MQLRHVLLPLAAACLLAGCGKEDAASRSLPRKELPTQLVEQESYCGENAYIHCAAICSLGPRISGTPAYEAQLDYLQKHLESAGWTVYRDVFSVRGVRMTNLRAIWGEDSAPRPMLLSCHIDTKRNVAPDFISADDGASGAACLLELARVLSGKAETSKQTELIFLDGEESFAPRMSSSDGLYGSTYDVARRKGTLPRWQLNLDMVGGRNKIIAIPGLDTSQYMYDQYERARKALRFPETRWTAWPDSYLDDHRPYLEAGVDSLNLIAHFVGSDWWHTPRDNMERICPRSLRETGEMVLQLLRQILPSA